MSSSLRPYGLKPPRLLCPWDFPGKNTGVGCHCLLQGIFPTQGIKPQSPALQADSLPSKPPGKCHSCNFQPLSYLLIGLKIKRAQTTWADQSEPSSHDYCWLVLIKLYLCLGIKPEPLGHWSAFGDQLLREHCLCESLNSSSWNQDFVDQRYVILFLFVLISKRGNFSITSFLKLLYICIYTYIERVRERYTGISFPCVFIIKLFSDKWS